MKIVIVTTRPFHLGHLAGGLAEMGHDVRMYGYMPRKMIKARGWDKVTYIDLFRRFLPISALALQGRFQTLQKRAIDKMFNIVDDYVEKNMPDCDVLIGLSGCAIKALKRAKRIGALAILERGSSHIADQLRIVTSAGGSRYSESYLARELSGYQYSDYINVLSNFAFQSFVKNGISGSKLWVNNLGVDWSRFRSDDSRTTCSNSNPRLLYVGGWSVRKGCDLFEEVLRLNPGWEMTHVGSVVDVPLPDLPNFKSLGHISNKNLIDFYSGNNIFILTSREDGFGMVLLEALACGMRLVCSRNTGAPDIKRAISNKDLVELLDDVNSDSLANGIKKQFDRLHTQGRGLLTEGDKEYFTWEFFSRRYYDNITRVLALQ